MNLPQALDALRNDPKFMRNVTHWKHEPARDARCSPFPENMSPVLRRALEARGIRQLFTHQAQAVEQIIAGENVIIVTPTASGKTLCYNIPIINKILDDPEARALYLFPTKALSQDQMHEIR